MAEQESEGKGIGTGEGIEGGELLLELTKLKEKHYELQQAVLSYLERTKANASYEPDSRELLWEALRNTKP